MHIDDNEALASDQQKWIKTKWHVWEGCYSWTTPDGSTGARIVDSAAGSASKFSAAIRPARSGGRAGLNETDRRWSDKKVWRRSANLELLLELDGQILAAQLMI